MLSLRLLGSKGFGSRHQTGIHVVYNKIYTIENYKLLFSMFSSPASLQNFNYRLSEWCKNILKASIKPKTPIIGKSTQCPNEKTY